MTNELLFSIINLAVLPFWLLMILAPEWHYTRWLMRSYIPPAVFSVLYAVLIVPHLPGMLPVLFRPDLDTITSALSRPDVAVVAWVHFIAFDLFVGRWAYLDAQERGIRHLFLVPGLVLMLMVGPLGLLYYLGLRQFAPRKA